MSSLHARRPRDLFLLLSVVSLIVCFASCVPIPKGRDSRVYGPHRIPEGWMVDGRLVQQFSIVWMSPKLYREPPNQCREGEPEWKCLEYSRERCHRRLSFLFVSEWSDVEKETSPLMELVQGYALASEFAGGDWPGTHRWRDWNIFLKSSKEYQNLLAPPNLKGWRTDSVVQKLEINDPTLRGILEIEWDSRFYPPEMGPQPGDEVLVAGRYVFDCGHEGKSPKAVFPSDRGFRSEIHPAAVIVVAHTESPSGTCIQTEFRIFGASRGGPVSAIPILFFHKFLGTYINPLGGRDYVFYLRSPKTGWILKAWTRLKAYNTGGRRRIVESVVEEMADKQGLRVTIPFSRFKPWNRLETSAVLRVEWEAGEK